MSQNQKLPKLTPYFDQKNERYGFKNDAGETIIQPKFQTANPFYQDCMVARYEPTGDIIILTKDQIDWEIQKEIRDQKTLYTFLYTF
jgi:hypothetical protein